MIISVRITFHETLCRILQTLLQAPWGPITSPLGWVAFFSDCPHPVCRLSSACIPRSHCCLWATTSGVQSLLCHQLQGLHSAPTTPSPASLPKPTPNTPAEGSSTAWNHPPSTSCCSLSPKTSCQLHTALLLGLLPSSSPDPPSGVSSSQQRLKHITKRELPNFAKAYQPIQMDFIRFLFIPHNDLLTLSFQLKPSPHSHT